jgi:hypothetical protein
VGVRVCVCVCVCVCVSVCLTVNSPTVRCGTEMCGSGSARRQAVGRVLSDNSGRATGK